MEQPGNRTRLMLEILSPDGVAFKGEVAEVVLPTALGEIAVLPGHEPLFSKLAEGEIAIVGAAAGGPEFVCVTGGFVEIMADRVSVLASYAVRSAEIEERKAEEARRRAEELLKKQQGARDYAAIEKDLKRSMLELKIAGKYRKRRTK